MPGRLAMPCFHHQMHPDQVQVFGVNAVVLDERMLADNLLDLLGILRRGGMQDFLPVMDIAFDKNGHHG